MNETRYIIEIKSITTKDMPRREWRQVRVPDPTVDPSVNRREQRDFEYVDDVFPQEVTRVLLLQTVDALDLGPVILAINGLSK